MFTASYFLSTDLKHEIENAVFLLSVLGLGLVLVSASAPRVMASATGPQRAIFILVEFQDVRHTKTPEEVKREVFDQVNRYYQSDSYNLTWFVGDVTKKWYLLPGNFSSYAVWPNRQGPQHWERARPLMEDAVRAADADVDFRKYYHVVILHAGWNYPTPAGIVGFGVSFFYGGNPDYRISTNDGVGVSNLTVIAEYDSLAVITHELAHALSTFPNGFSLAPDLYDIDAFKQNSNGNNWMGYWDLMSAQFRSGNPQGHSAWTKLKLGWVEDPWMLLLLKGQDANVTLAPLESAPDAHAVVVVKIELSPNTYYLLEDRQLIGVDRELTDYGMLVTIANDQLYPNGNGPVRVVPCPKCDVDHATFDRRSGKSAAFQDNSLNLTVLITRDIGADMQLKIGWGPKALAALKESAKAEISSANMTIQATASAGRTVGLEKATILLLNAVDAFNKGDYNSAIMLAQQAEEAADSATTPIVASTTTASSAKPSTSSTTSTTVQESLISLPQWFAACIVFAAIMGIVLVVVRHAKSRPQKNYLPQH
jgi:M6 family metalloprotease-like protein